MSSRGPYRRHSAQFKLQLCHNIRSGILGRRDAQRKYALSANLIQTWLTQFDRGSSGARRPRPLLWLITKRRSQPWSARLVSSPWSSCSKKTRHACASQRQRELLHCHRPDARSVRWRCEVMGLPGGTFYRRRLSSDDLSGPVDRVHSRFPLNVARFFVASAQVLLTVWEMTAFSGSIFGGTQKDIRKKRRFQRVSPVRADAMGVC